MQQPSIGRIVHYTLSEHDANAINKRRSDASAKLAGGQETGFVVHAGNGVHAGEVYPLVITRIWGSTPGSAVNGQVVLDGNDSLWVTSVAEGEGPRSWVWPPRI
jgi:hypothetical protein